ncbi:hypothetical protein SEMRO_3693_G350410.1 [Seminavis robusta]|uniref:Uncharacterized protein n=1 Tax=Seminavis robusta TaxID=568900 RepID=A0A9N8I0D0_9STRA|nr:hypothetical protein SEMRO_3693_G350410.1 [Seminavis robusta]|eukprot:Sro3693_g350410.1 n/a (216) ;mRNA; r:4242-4889
MPSSVCTKEAFKVFQAKNGYMFPFNSVKATRTSFHTRWVLMFNRGEKPLFCPSRHQLVPASTFLLEDLQHLIIEGQAIPLPPDYCEIADCMYYWGRTMDHRWYYDVVNFFSSILSPTPHPNGINKKCLFRYILSLYVQTRLDFNWFVVQQWHNYFDLLYVQTDDFFFLATSSTSFVRNHLMAATYPQHSAEDSVSDYMDENMSEVTPEVVRSAEE